MTKPYSLIITSCQRDDLLVETLDSFFDTADWMPQEVVIVDDGPERPAPDGLRKHGHRNIRWICNGRRLGQMATCDRAIREAKNELIFWSEEDWLYQGSGWLKESLRILETHPEVVTVSLRGRDCNGHPLMDNDALKTDHGKFFLQVPGWRGGFGNFGFNPGLRRLSDYKKIGSYQQHTKPEAGNLGGELALSQLYASLGYFIAALPGQPCIQHLGAGRSKAVEKVEIKDPKILIAVKAGQTLKYTKWESEKSPHYDPSIAYQGKPYCTSDRPIHVSVEKNPRLQAVRDTWWKDIQNHPNVTGKFFFGSPALNEPQADEVYLDVPDDYEHLAPKTKLICKWAYDNEFDYVCLVDDDTFVFVDRLIQEPQTYTFDYAGYLHGSVCSGGTGYWLSRKAMAEMVRNGHSHWAEDVSVGMTMKYAGIEPVMLPGHRSGMGDHHFFAGDVFNPAKLNGNEVTMHAVFPDVMRQCYAHVNGS